MHRETRSKTDIKPFREVGWLVLLLLREVFFRFTLKLVVRCGVVLPPVLAATRKWARRLGERPSWLHRLSRTDEVDTASVLHFLDFCTAPSLVLRRRIQSVIGCSVGFSSWWLFMLWCLRGMSAGMALVVLFSPSGFHA